QPACSRYQDIIALAAKLNQESAAVPSVSEPTDQEPVEVISPDAVMMSAAETTEEPKGKKVADPYQELATFYARLLNAMEEQGDAVSQHELQTIDHELSEGDWLLAHDGGKWTAKHAEASADDPIEMAALHAPKGGVTIAG